MKLLSAFIGANEEEKNMSYVDEVIELVVKQNPSEPEFHQAVKEVLESLRPVVDANEEKFRREALLERIVNPERQLKFRIPWVDDKGQVHSASSFFLEGVKVENASLKKYSLGNP